MLIVNSNCSNFSKFPPKNHKQEMNGKVGP